MRVISLKAKGHVFVVTELGEECLSHAEKTVQCLPTEGAEKLNAVSVKNSSDSLLSDRLCFLHREKRGKKINPTKESFISSNL